MGYRQRQLSHSHRFISLDRFFSLTSLSPLLPCIACALLQTSVGNLLLTTTALLLAGQTSLLEALVADVQTNLVGSSNSRTEGLVSRVGLLLVGDGASLFVRRG